jgi:hypothetical protein
VGHYVGEQYKVTIQEAAERLSVKEGAIRKRIERGTIRSEKDVDDGRVYVYVDEPPLEDRDTGYDNGHDMSHDAGYDMLIRSQQEEIGFLRRELERKDALLLNMTEVMKALHPPQEAAAELRESDVRPSEEEAGTQPPEGLGQEQRSSWWRRFFGLE